MYLTDEFMDEWDAQMLDLAEEEAYRYEREYQEAMDLDHYLRIDEESDRQESIEQQERDQDYLIVNCPHEDSSIENVSSPFDPNAPEVWVCRDCGMEAR